MNGKQAHNMTDEELNIKLGELNKELFSLRFSHATGRLSNPNLLVTCKRDIARVKTVLRDRQLHGGKSL